MTKDRKARRNGRITVMALANMIAALVDTMREADVPNHVVCDFLQKLDTLNRATLDGAPGAVMADFVAIIRSAVPDND